MLNIITLTPERLRRLSTEGVWIVLGQAAAVVGALVGVRLLTELLDPAAYGELALGMTAAALVNQVVLGPLSNGATRFYAPAVEQGDLGGYFAGVRQLVRLAACMVALTFLVALAAALAFGRPDLVGMAMATFAFAFVSGSSAVLGGVQNAARQRAVVALHQGAESWARFLIAAALLHALGATGTVAMWGYAAASTLILGSQYRSALESTRHRGNAHDAHSARAWRQRIWSYAWPFGAWGIFTWMQLASDRWALGHFATTQEVGLYAVLYQLGYYPISMATGITVQFLAPILFTRAGDARDSTRNDNVTRLIWRLTILALALTCVAALLALAFHDEIFRLFAAKNYAAVSVLLPLVVLSGGVFAAGQTMALHLMSLMKTEAMVTAKIVTAILGVVLNFAGAYWYGMTGVVLAGLMFAVSYLTWMCMLSLRARRMPPAQPEQPRK